MCPASHSRQQSHSIVVLERHPQTIVFNRTRSKRIPQFRVRIVIVTTLDNIISVNTQQCMRGHVAAHPTPESIVAQSVAFQQQQQQQLLHVRAYRKHARAHSEGN